MKEDELVCRAIAVLCVIALKASIPEIAYTSIYSAGLVGHIILATIYSSRQIREIFAKKEILAPLGALALSAWTSLLWIPNVVLYFGFHHALSETYTVANANKEPGARGFADLNLLRFLINAFVYFKLLGPRLTFSFLTPNLTLCGLFGSLLIFSLLLGQRVKQETLSLRSAVGLVAFEGIGVGLVLALPEGAVTFHDIIFYHIVFWLFYPLLHNGVRMFNYLGGTIFVSGTLLYFTPIRSGSYSLSFAQWEILTTTVGYLHISLSFFLSKANPFWILSPGGLIAGLRRPVGNAERA